MRSFQTLLVLCLGGLLSCATVKNDTAITQVQEEEFPFVEGVITNDYREQGCDFLFEFTDREGHKMLVRPIELDEKYQKDGLKVRMRFRMSRIQNGGCDLAHPVIIEEIERIIQ